MRHAAHSKAASPSGPAGARLKTSSAAGDWGASSFGQAQRMPAYFNTGTPMVPLTGETLQPKLTVGRNDDPDEQEADQVADSLMLPGASVTSISALPRISRQAGVSDEEEETQAQPVRRQSTEPGEEKEDDEEKVQRESAPVAGGEGGSVPSSFGDNLGAGQSLPSASRGFFESRLGHDFSDVRIHTGGEASQSARSIGALAYTAGTNLVFDTGHFSPGTKAGDRVLAHELAHVVQQRRNRVNRVQRITRVELLQGLDRLHTLWSITYDNYRDARLEIMALPAIISTSSAMPPLLDQAIRQNREPTLAAPVALEFLNIRLSASVGLGQTNNTADILALQTALHALGLISDVNYGSERAAVRALTTPTVPDPEHNIAATLRGITDFKVGVVGRTLGWAAMRADEQQHGVDRYAGRTYEFRDFSIFVPRGMRSGTNRVHVFFSPGPVQGISGRNAVLTHGLRGASDATEYILIGVVGIDPGFTTISTAEIEACLTQIGRPTNINGLRLSAHSRGYRGLRETVRRRLINLSLVDRVVILDAQYRDIAATLRHSGIPPSRIVAYGVLTRTLDVPGSRTIELPRNCMGAIGYIRLIQDAMITRPDVTIPLDIRRQLLTLPPRGSFTTSATPRSGQTNILGFCRAHRAEFNAIIANETNRTSGLKFFIESHNLLRTGIRYDRTIYMHHLFVAELAHEITE